jgi:FkbM family methyltransferase
MFEGFLRKIPNFKGKRRLARYLYKNTIEEKREVKIVGRFGCEYTLPNIKENVAFDIFIQGIYEPATHEFLVKQVPLNARLLDLGMNIGAVSIPLSKRRKDLNILGVEASPWVYKYLVENIKANQLSDRITAYNFALYHEEKQIPFNSPSDYFGQGSLFVGNPKTSIMVEAKRLDNFLSAEQIGDIGFIKIDIEGFEYFAFLGAQKLLSANQAPDILFEFADFAEKNSGLQPGSAQQLLLDWGYRLYLLNKKELVPLNGKLTSGFHLIYATKK